MSVGAVLFVLFWCVLFWALAADEVRREKPHDDIDDFLADEERRARQNARDV